MDVGMQKTCRQKEKVAKKATVLRILGRKGCWLQVPIPDKTEEFRFHRIARPGHAAGRGPSPWTVKSAQCLEKMAPDLPNALIGHEGARYSSRIVVPVGCTHHASPIRSKPRRPSEFPALKALIHKSVAKQKGKVQYVLVAEDTASESMALFLQKNRHVMPDGRLFHDTQGQIRDLIRPGLPGGELKLPSTLLVDEKGVIRQAFVGPLVVFEYGTQALS